MLEILPVTEAARPNKTTSEMTYPNRSMKHPTLTTRPFAGRYHALGMAAVSLTLALGAWAAELTVPSDSFTTVQDAVDAASPGDTITVLPGSYDGVLIFTPGLKINAATESGPVVVNDFLILAEDVGIEGFTVSDGITLIDSARAVVSHNSVSAGGVAILAVDSPATVIDHNTTVGADVGILLSSSDGVQADHNTVAANSVGISVDSCSGARLSHNNVCGTDGSGIEIFASSGGQIEYNSAKGTYGIFVSDSCGNTFQFNSAVGSLYGLYTTDNPVAPCNTYFKNRSDTAFPSLNFWGAK